MSNQNKAYLYAFFAVLMWSTVATAFKLTLKFVSFDLLLFYASLTSLLIFFISIIIQNKLYLFKQINLMDYFQSVVLGFLNPFLYYLILFKAYDLLPAQEAQPLNYTWGIVVVLLSIPILKQKINIYGFIALLFGFFGVVIISTHGEIRNVQLSNTWGVFLALISSVVWALFWIYNVKDKRDEIIKLFLNFFHYLSFNFSSSVESSSFCSFI